MNGVYCIASETKYNSVNLYTYEDVAYSVLGVHLSYVEVANTHSSFHLPDLWQKRRRAYDNNCLGRSQRVVATMIASDS